MANDSKPLFIVYIQIFKCTWAQETLEKFWFQVLLRRFAILKLWWCNCISSYITTIAAYSLKESLSNHFDFESPLLCCSFKTSRIMIYYWSSPRVFICSHVLLVTGFPLYNNSTLPRIAQKSINVSEGFGKFSTSKTWIIQRNSKESFLQLLFSIPKLLHMARFYFISYIRIAIYTTLETFNISIRRWYGDDALEKFSEF